MKHYYDKCCNESIQYKPRDMVLLEGTNIKTERPMKKFDDLQYGPFKCEALVDPQYCECVKMTA